MSRQFTSNIYKAEAKMKLEHIAIWTGDLERLRQFYVEYFGATSNAKYINVKKQFESYFLSFQTGARLEIMYSPRVQSLHNNQSNQQSGYAHIAFSLDTKAQVDALTSRLQSDGYQLLDGPRYTGDGYYESSFLDPDGNRIELTI
jgi:lactoylglutathione lyase